MPFPSPGELSDPLGRWILYRWAAWNAHVQVLYMVNIHHVLESSNVSVDLIQEEVLISELKL